MILSVRLDNDIYHVTHQHLNTAGCLKPLICMMQLFRLSYDIILITRYTLCSCNTRTCCAHNNYTTVTACSPCLGKNLSSTHTMADHGRRVHAGTCWTGHFHNFTHNTNKIKLMPLWLRLLVASDMGRNDQRLFNNQYTHLCLLILNTRARL